MGISMKKGMRVVVFLLLRLWRLHHPKSRMGRHRLRRVIEDLSR